jgi:hypothetical protein
MAPARDRRMPPPGGRVSEYVGLRRMPMEYVFRMR